MNGLRIDHVGLTVPDIDVATTFLRDAPGLGDLGIQHVAVRVADIDAAARRVVDAGAVLLAAPAPLPGPEAGPGRMWVYCRLPWGGLLELVSRP
ncbi:MAG: hypothetical protein ABS81_00290 [Pseudonocardia sp. SCN 72-86]|nr:MAG: hypothetical protein ABS81_00290 [Pseudonocardia sp. SCN 72-86]